MIQHLLLMMVAPPLLWLGAPLFPMLRGLPRPIRTYWVAPLASLAAAAPSVFATADASGRRRWLLFVAATWLWHVPPVYELALRSGGWHYLQHVCFLGIGAPLLVSRRPAVSEPAALVALAARSLT